MLSYSRTHNILTSCVVQLELYPRALIVVSSPPTPEEKDKGFLDAPCCREVPSQVRNHRETHPEERRLQLLLDRETAVVCPLSWAVSDIIRHLGITTPTSDHAPSTWSADAPLDSRRASRCKTHQYGARRTSMRIQDAPV